MTNQQSQQMVASQQEQPVAANAPEMGCGKAAGRPRAIDLETRMQSLVETAGKLFLQHGYSKVSLEAIAREAHVAVRTIYVKFGGKAGLFNAVIVANRARFFSGKGDMDTDLRPFRQIIDEFAERFLKLVTAPEAVSMQRMVIAEMKTNPEMAETFNDAGPRQTREILSRLFAREDVRAQLRADLPFAQLPSQLLNCIIGDQITRLLSPMQAPPCEQEVAAMHQRLALFYRSVLREPLA